ncbi:hypothetical protein ACLKA6_010726 [Drosophila palustris]
MRPINEVDSRRMVEILSGLASSSSSSSHRSTSELREANTTSQISSGDGASSTHIADFTDQMLDYVRQEFERPCDEQSSLTDDQTETIMAMLREEQVAHNQYAFEMENKKNKPSSSKRRR